MTTIKIFRILIGGLIGSIISLGLAIGLIFGGIQVVWWLAIVLSVVGIIIGGFFAGFISRDKFPGTLAGILSGLIVFVGIVLFFWLIVKNKLLYWFSQYADIDQTIDAFLSFFGIVPTSKLGVYLDNLITTKFNDAGLNINAFIPAFVPKFSLVLGAIFGGIALLLNTFAGRLGGRMNKIDEIIGDD
ncbi:MAG: hypothetical protein K9W42_12715 [Candidatus Heimdallarchaeota archaeon]|nr:hypothetical protein [Candidatus Heimdallarchaeota archaeon]